MKLLILTFFIFSLSAKSQETSIKKSEFEMEKIEVSGSAEKSNRTLVEIPIQVDLVTEEDLNKIGANTLMSALSVNSDIEFTGGSRSNIQKPQIRGMGEDRVLVVVDGIKQSQGSIHRGSVFTDLSLLKSVEVIKGSGATLYGSGALGGVISLESKMADDFSTRIKKSGVEFGVHSHSVSKTTGSRVTVFGNSKKSGTVISYSGSSAQDLKLGGGKTLDDSDSTVSTLSANFYYKANSNHRTEFFAERFQEVGQWPANPTEQVTDRNYFRNYLTDTTNKRESFQLKHKYNPKSNLTNFMANVYSNKIQTNYLKYKPQRSASHVFANSMDNVTTTYEQNYTITNGAEFRNTSEVVKGDNIISATYGAEYIAESHKGLKNGAKNNKYPDGRSDLLSVYVQPSYEVVDNFRIVPGARYDSYNLQSADLNIEDKKEYVLTSKLSAMYFVNSNFSIYTSYGEAFKAPKVQESFAYGEHFRDENNTLVNTFLPNPDLKSETSNTVETGVHYMKQDKVNEIFFKADAALFETQAKDFVYRNFTVTTTQYLNRDRVEIKGGEIGLSTGYKRLNGRVSFTKLESKDLNTNKPIETTPGDKTMLSAGALISRGQKISLGTSLNHYAKKENIENLAGAPLGFEDYYTQDLYINWELKNKMFERTRIGLRFNNIHDRKYTQHGSTMPGVGRDVRLKITLNL